MKMKNNSAFVAAFLGLGLLLACSALAFSLNRQAQRRTGSQADSAPVPAFHAAPPRGRLPATLPARLFATDPVARRTYAAAARIKSVLYQLPCYCHCDSELGHKSLLDCYVGTHASVCATCKMELAYAYGQTKRGRTAAQIRQGIIGGAWKNVDMTKWGALAPAKPAAKTR